MNNILLDCDGVLADFVSASLKIHKRLEKHRDIKKFNFYTDWGMSSEEFWEPLRGSFFWENLRPYPWSAQFLRELKLHGDITIVTSPSTDPECCTGKMKWLERNFNFSPTDIVVGSKKWLLAGNGILIDDSQDNANRFRQNGGLAILFPQSWNSATGNWETVIDKLGNC